MKKIQVHFQACFSSSTDMVKLLIDLLGFDIIDINAKDNQVRLEPFFKYLLGKDEITL